MLTNASSSTPRFEENSSWYRAYVLIILLVISIHSLCTRNLPSYLATVQVPGCETVCQGVNTAPLCGATAERWKHLKDKKLDKKDQCEICRASGGSTLSAWNSILSEMAEINPAVAAVIDEETTLEFQAMAFSRAVRDGNFYNMADGACMHDWEYGGFIGYGFALAFGLGSIPAGWICDRRSRIEVAAISLLAWSVATAMQATAHDFWSILGCRAVVGLAQAFAMPAAISIGSDVFASSRERQNMAMAVLSIGFYLGSGCSSFSIWFTVLAGWRWAVLIAGLTGMLLAALLYLTVREPERTEFSAPCSILGVRDEVFIKSRVARWCLLAATAKMLSVYVLGSYLPLWYSRKNLPGYSNVAYAGFNALIIASAGLLSTFIGYVLSAYWAQYDSRAPCWIGVIGAIASIPLIILVLSLPSFLGSMICWFGLIFVSEMWFAPIIALVQRSVRQSHRRQAIPMFLIATTLGANVGPALVGFMDPGSAMVGTHILWITVLANLIAAVGFLFTAREITLDPIAAGVGEQEDDVPKSMTGIVHWLAPF